MLANRGYAFDVTRPRDQADRHIEWQKVYHSDCASACLRPFRSHGKSCWAIGCTNRYEKDTNLSFYRFPVKPMTITQPSTWAPGTRSLASQPLPHGRVWYTCVHQLWQKKVIATHTQQVHGNYQHSVARCHFVY